MQNQNQNQSTVFHSFPGSASGNGSSNSGSSSSGRKTNHLQREGIAPSSGSSRYGNISQGRRHLATDQQRMAEAVFDPKRFVKKRSERNDKQHAPQHVQDTGEAMTMFLPRAQWIELGDGWYQTTPTGTGSTNRYGLHSVVDSSMGQMFICVYEPRTREGVQSCTSENPEYDLSLSVKSIKKQEMVSSSMAGRQHFDILFGFKSVTDFFSLTGDLLNQQWILSRTNGLEITPLNVVDMDIKANVFYDILLQVRGGSISVDIDNIPIFTSVRFADTIGGSLSGILGVLAKGTKFAIKGWQLRGASNRRHIGGKSAYNTPKHGSGGSRVGGGGGGNGGGGNGGGGGRTPMSLRDSLGRGGMACSGGVNSDEGYMPERRGPPPVPSGGGGPGSSRASRGNPASHGDGDRSSSLEMTLMRGRSLLKERHDGNIVDMVMRDIVQQGLGVSFDDIAALDTAKRLLNEAVVLPLMMPELFTGIRKPWKGVLLFGPPGTASLISKFRGESEKIVKCLFEAARFCAPAVVFLDEIDALVSSRGSEGEHEASRRLKTEFFSQMDGISSCEEGGRGSASGGASGVMVLATTNCPWDLDEAIRRRLEKRIYIPLPDSAARMELFRICLANIEVGPYISTQALSEATEGYSGADIHLVCREAAMMPMRRLLSQYSPQQINAMKQEGALEIPKISLRDFYESIENTKPSVSQEYISRYALWEQEYGSR